MGMIQGISSCFSTSCRKIFTFCPLVGRCHNLNWRDYIMASGLVFTITGLVISILEGLTLYTGLFTVATLALFVGTYHVNRVKELETMEKNLASMQSKLTHFEKENQRLTKSVDTFDKKLKEQEKLNETYQKENTQYNQLNAKMKEKLDVIENLRKAIEKLPSDFKPHEILLGQLLTKLQEVEKNLEEKKAALSAVEARLEEREKGLKEVENLFREQLTLYQEVLGALQTVGKEIKDHLPSYVHLATKITEFLTDRSKLAS